MWLILINPRPAGEGGQRAPCGFSQIAPEVLGISLWNLPYLSGQQFHTLCQKITTQVIIGQPWVTSEWRDVSPILTSKMGLRESPPLVQFKSYDQLTYMKWRKISRATKLLSRIFKILKITENFQKKVQYLQKWLRYNIKHVKNRHFSRHFATLPWFSEFCFLTDFDTSKSVLGSFFAFFAKIWPKNMYRSSKSRFLFYLFHLVTWDDLDLHYCHKAQEMILTDVSDTIHADSLALFALNIEILLAVVTKPEKSKNSDFDLTCDVISDIRVKCLTLYG